MKVETTVRKRGGIGAVAARVNVTQATVRNWIKADRLPEYAARMLGVEPRGTFKKAGRPRKVVHRSWWQRLIDWMMN